MQLQILVKKEKAVKKRIKNNNNGVGFNTGVLLWVHSTNNIKHEKNISFCFSNELWIILTIISLPHTLK